jgi:Fe-S cluster biogenesis protein NfuA
MKKWLVEADSSGVYTQYYVNTQRYIMAVQPVSTTQLPQLDLRQRVQTVLNSMRSVIQWDGGDVELVDVTAEGVVAIRFHGACIGCPSSQATLKLGIEKNIREKIPEIKEVVSVDDS